MTIFKWIIFIVLLCVLYSLIWVIIAPIEWIISFVVLCVVCGLIWLIIARKPDDTDDTDEEVRKKVRERLYKELGKS